MLALVKQVCTQLQQQEVIVSVTLQLGQACAKLYPLSDRADIPANSKTFLYFSAVHFSRVVPLLLQGDTCATMQLKCQCTFIKAVCIQANNVV